jgi:hypothetical protein
MKQYNPKTVLRQISNRVLKDMFEHHGHVIEAEWEDLAPRQVQDIYDAFLKLPEADRRDFEVELQDIHTVAQVDKGVRLLVEEAAFDGLDVAAELDRFDSRYDKAVWMLLNHGDVWEKAAVLAHAETLQNRSWHKRNGLPRKAPDMSAPVIEGLENDISAFYWQAEGRGQLCRIDHLRRNAHLDYFFVYLSDHPDTEIIWDEEGNWQRIKRCHAFEVVFVYDRDMGTMDVHAQGGRKVVEPLQKLFAKAVLGIALEPEDPAECPHRLDGLKERTFAFDTDPEDGITQVAIRLLSVSPMGNPKKKITVQLATDGNPEDIYVALEHDLNHEKLPISLLRVEKARISMQLDGYGRSKSLTFDISPRTCSLKSKPERLRELGEKYLRRWGIEAA